MIRLLRRLLGRRPPPGPEVRERCRAFHFQYRCSYPDGHDGCHRTTGDDGSIYAWAP